MNSNPKLVMTISKVCRVCDYDKSISCEIDTPVNLFNLDIIYKKLCKNLKPHKHITALIEKVEVL